MQVTILVTQTVDIPDEHLVDLARRVRAAFDMPPDSPVHIEDLLNQAEGQGLVQLPHNYRVDDDSEFTDDLLMEIATQEKKSKRRKEKS